MTDNIYSGREVKVLRIRRHTSKEYSFLLDARVKGLPGQFVIVGLPGAGEVPVSVSGFMPDCVEITVRNAGKVTSLIHKIKSGGYLTLRGPYGNGFPLKELENRHLLIIVGGSALAAVKPLIEYALTDKNFTLKKLDVLAGFRSPRHILFQKELKSWAKEHNINPAPSYCEEGLPSRRCGVKVVVTVDSDEDYAWMGSIGFVVEHIKKVPELGEDTKVIIIGPPLMMANSVRELLNRRIKEENIYLSFERHMKCGVGKCGHCRIGDRYVCLDGPVFSYREAKGLID